MPDSSKTAPTAIFAVPEPDLTPAEIIQRAIDMRPKLIERQAETEARTYYSEETHREFQEAGFYRIMQPRRFGGYEFDAPTFFRVVMELARGCPSTAWCFCLASAHVVQTCNLFDEEAQELIFGPDGEFRAASFGGPMGTIREADGGYRVTATWPYASGCPYSTHFIGHSFLADDDPDGPPAQLVFALPRSEWEMLDDWGDVMGLKGSGSHSVKTVDGFLPANFVVEGSIVYGRTTGIQHRVHEGVLYRGRTGGLFSNQLSAVMVGAALGALDEYERIITTRTATFAPKSLRVDLQDYQRFWGLASGKIAAARGIIVRVAEEYMELAQRVVDTGEEFTPEDDMRLLMMALEGGRLAWDAVQSIVFRTGGSAAARDGQMLQRYWRDMCTIWSHNGPSQDEFFATHYARVRFGMPSEFAGGGGDR